MSGRSGDFGAVACLPHTQNPIQVAQALWLQRTRGRLSLERVPPMVLAGAAAHVFALTHVQAAAVHPALCCSAAAPVAASSCAAAPAAAASHSAPCPLLTEASSRKWQSYSQNLNVHESADKSNVTASSTAASAAQSDVSLAADQLSTVGAIVVAPNGDVFAGVSSGGIWMKSCGRVGHAATFGAGCSAYNSTRDRAGAACSISGTGEQIMERLLSFSIAQQMRQAVSVPVAAAAAAATTGKRKNAAARSHAKRQKLPDRASADSTASSSEESDESDSDSLEAILRRSLLDQQPAAFDTSPATQRESLAAGLVALQVSPPSSQNPSAPRCIELLWAHSTPHFAVGYATRDRPASSFISVAEAGSVASSSAASSAAAAPRPPIVSIAGQRFRFVMDTV